MSLSKATKQDRERFAKCFVIMSENCKLWILQFVQKRIQQDHRKTLIEFINSSPDLSIDKRMKSFPIRRTWFLLTGFDISELFVVIKTGKLLKPGIPGELKSVGHQNNTIEDQIDRIREIRSTFMHTVEAYLDENDYDDHINEFKDIGKRFEVINGEKNGTYTMEIEEIHNRLFDIWEVDRIVTLHKRYVEMTVKEDPERFAQCFVIMSENCKLWILKFVENRIQQDHGKTLIDFINSSPDLPKNKIVKEFLIRRTTSLQSEIDFSALCAVIKTGKLLKPGIHGELKSVGRQHNTIGDQIDRIREIRSTFMHTAEANLDENDYDDHIVEFKDIGKRFEVINGEKNGTYTMEIEEIHNRLFDISGVERIVTRHKLYLEMAIKEDRERFAKCFVIISENCKLWILKFVEDRIKQRNGKTLIKFINSSPALPKDKIVKAFLNRRKTSLSSEIDISALCAVIKTGNLLKHGVPGELKSVGHQHNTTGDQIDRIREIRNTFMHTAEAKLDDSDYDDHINEFKDIGERFEVINGEKNGTYTMQIDEIHDTLFDTTEVEHIVVRYKLYVEMVQRIEMPAPVQERPAHVTPRREIAGQQNCGCLFCLLRLGHASHWQCEYSRPKTNNECILS